MSAFLTELIELDTHALRNRIYRLQFTRTAQLQMLEDFNTLIKYLPPLRAIQHIGEFADGARRAVCDDIARSIRSGKGIADGMEYWFDPILVAAIRIGEKTGGFAELIRKTLDQMNTQHGSLSRGVLILGYPAILTIAVAIFALGLNDRLVPLAEGLARGRSLPADMQFLKTFGGLVANWGLAILLIFTGVVSALRWGLVNYIGELRRSLDALPIFEQYRYMLGARFMQTYSILKALSSTEVQIIEMALRGATPFYAIHLRRMLARAGGGSANIVDVIDTGLIHPKHVARLRILSESAEYTAALEETAIKVVKDTTKTISATARITSTIWLAMCGYVIARLVMAVMSVDEIASLT